MRLETHVLWGVGEGGSEGRGGKHTNTCVLNPYCTKVTGKTPLMTLARTRWSTRLGPSWMSEESAVNCGHTGTSGVGKLADKPTS